MYTCQNKTCAIAIKKAGFPAMMNCPMCQEPLFFVEKEKEQLLSVEDEQLLQSLPYVIAYPLKQALLEPHAWSRINLLKDTFLNYLKYLGLLTASEFFNSPFKERKIVDLFQQNLAQPSFGSWNAFTRECLQYLKNKNHSFFCDDLVAYYEAIETSKKRKLYTGEIEVTDSSNSGKIHYVKQQATAIGMLINFRNRYLGHGLTLDTTTSEKLWNEYFPVFRTLLEQLTFCEKFPMLKQEASLFYTLQGIEIIPFDVKEKPLSKVSIYNINTGKSMPVIPFFIVPGELAIDREDKSNIFSYESNTGVRITFFSPEGDMKDASGKLLDKLQFLLRDKQKETPYSPDTFIKELFLERIADENKIALQTLIAEKKVIEGIYQQREEMEIKLREWIGVRANIFFIAAEAGSGKTNLLVEMQKQYAERNLASLFIRASRMEKTSLKEELTYQLNLDPSLDLSHYKFLAGTQAEPTFILIDGLNEAHYAERIWQEILEISTLFEPGSLKFVITSRANSKSDLGRYAISESQIQYLYGENKDHEAILAAFSFWLTPLDMKEMEGAWDNYVAKDKKRFKPLFSFNDIATFDRGLYLQLNNPLVLRIFLETYNGKKLTKKGIKYLHIWKDWIATFTDEEQKFMQLLADAVWEKGENELLLDTVLHNENLQPYFLTDNISAPYQRLLTMGWISRYVKDLTIYVSFTVEGVLLYLLGTKLNRQNPALSSDFIGEILNTGTKLQKSAIESFLVEQALEGKMDLIGQLIDEVDEKLELCVIPLLYFLKYQGVEKTIEKLLENPTENDWLIFIKLNSLLESNQLAILQQEFLMSLIPINSMETYSHLILAILSCGVLNFEESLKYLKIIEEEKDKIPEEEISEDFFFLLGKMYNKIGDYKQAEVYLIKSIELNQKIFGKISQRLANYYSYLSSTYNAIGRYDDSIEYSNKCLSINLEFYSHDTSSVAANYGQIGLSLEKKNRFDEALSNHCQSLEIYYKLYGECHEKISLSYNNIAVIYLKQNHFEEALRYFNKCLDIDLKIFGDVSKEMAATYNNIGGLLDSIEDYDGALSYYEKSLDIQLKILKPIHPSIANSYNNIGAIYFAKEEFKSSLKFFIKSAKIELKAIGNKHHKLAEVYGNIAECYKALHKYELAIKYFNKAFKINLNVNSIAEIAICYDFLDNKHKALDIYVSLSNAMYKNYGINDLKTKEFVFNANRLAKDLGKEEELQAWMKTVGK